MSIYREDNDPVYYCTRCYSLAIKTEAGQDYCSACGCTDVGVLPNIDVWEQLYISRFGHPYVNHKKY